MQAASKKDILFFSNFCDYCNDLIGLIVKKNLKNEFMMVCIDNNKYQLPYFVDRVPIIFTRSGEILYDESITNYIEHSFQVENQEIAPFSLHTTNYSTSFSFIDDSASDMPNKAYTTLGHDQQIITASEESSNGAKPNKFDTSVLDKYMQEREADAASFKKIMGRM